MKLYLVSALFLGLVTADPPHTTGAATRLRDLFNRNHVQGRPYARPAPGPAQRPPDNDSIDPNNTQRPPVRPAPGPTPRPTDPPDSVIPCIPRSVQSRKLIVGGTETETREYPFVVSLHDKDGHFCGGTLIGERWVLTAAHCTQDLAASKLTVKVGQHSLDDKKDPCVEKLAVKRIVNHPRYNPRTEAFDIALLELASPSLYPPIGLSRGVGEAKGTALMAIGWGATSEEGSGSFSASGSGDWYSYSASDSGDWYSYSASDSGDWYSYSGSGSSSSDDWGIWWGNWRRRGGDADESALLEVNLQAFSNQRCERSYGASGLGYSIKDHMMCAGDETGEKDTCYGDSGGPLFVRSGGRYIQVGITSFGAECGSTIPAVYTRVSSFLSSFVCPTANIGC